MKPVRLQLNHRTNPLGIDGRELRFTWNVEGGITQAAYRVTVQDSAEALNKKTSRSKLNLLRGVCILYRMLKSAKPYALFIGVGFYLALSTSFS